jgi:anti-anti-sigma factor
MKIQTESDTVRVTDLSEIDEARAGAIHDGICAALPSAVRAIEIDLSKVRALDSSGVGVLVAMYDTVSRRRAPVIWRLLNPAPHVRQLLELMRLHRIFEITPARGQEAGA